MILQIRTKDNLEFLLQQSKSPSWVIAEYRMAEIKSIEIYQFDGKKVLKADFDAVNSVRTETDRLIVAFRNGFIEAADVDWIGQNPVRYKEEVEFNEAVPAVNEIDPNSIMLTKEQIEKEIADGIYFTRKIELAKMIFDQFNDSEWSLKLIEDSYTDYNDLEEGITALKFIFHDLGKKESVIQLIKNNLDRVYSIYECGLYANFILLEIGDKKWAEEIIEHGIAQITIINTDEWGISKAYGDAANFVLINFNDIAWASELMDIAISKMKTNGVATDFSNTFNEQLDEKQIELLKNKIIELPETVDDFVSSGQDVNEDEQHAYSLLVLINLLNYELSDFDLLNQGELGILDVKSVIENYLPDNEINYKLISATEESVENEGECIHQLWFVIDIGDQDPNDFIPNNQDAFLSISGELETRACCYIVPKKYVSSFENFNPDFDEIMSLANEKYMSYLEGDFDSGFYM